MGLGKARRWALLPSAEFEEELKRLPSKHRSQVARKSLDLANDPHPSGSKTSLVGYNGLCRMRVGDYRVIYAYDDRVVHLLTLRRRTEDTYEHLDDIEVRQLQDFQVEPLPRSEAQVVREWEELAKKWAAPRPDHPEPLPEAVTEDMLKNLNIPAEYWPQLLFLTTADGLLDCETDPIKHRDQLLERLCPRANSVQEDATAVVLSGMALRLRTVHL